jgi:predicted transposase YbfD/YdcC
VEYGLVLGQVKVPKKGQESAAVQDILHWLELDGCVVTADALHCQTDTARLIVEKGGDYVLPVKRNQNALHTALRSVFDYESAHGFAGVKHSTFEHVDKGHARLETRRYTVIHDPSYINEINAKGQWWHLGSLLKVERIRQTGKQFSKVSRQIVYGISSLVTHARNLAPLIRGHWGIENRLHWRLDVVFREDL